MTALPQLHMVKHHILVLSSSQDHNVLTTMLRLDWTSLLGRLLLDVLTTSTWSSSPTDGTMVLAGLPG